MFNSDFYPSNSQAIQNLLEGLDLHGKIVLEPSVKTDNFF